MSVHRPATRPGPTHRPGPAAQLLVIAKAPVAGRVKTRLCPPCTPAEAARLAAAALVDTLDTVRRTLAAGRVLALAGMLPTMPAGFTVIPQRGMGLPARLANAFSDAAPAGAARRTTPTFLLGMDTPQLTPALLGTAIAGLETADAVLGLAEDGGWWGLGLHDPANAEVLRGIPTSTRQTGSDTLSALRERGLSVVQLPVLRDVDTIADATAVAAAAPHTRFGAELGRLRNSITSAASA